MKRPNKSTRWGNRVTFCDTETSGLDETQDKITQVACIRLLHNLDNPLDLAVEQEFEIKFQMEGHEVDPEVAKLNGFDKAIWERNAVPRRKAMKQVLPLFEDSAIGGNNPSFDKKFLESEARAHRLEWPKMGHYRLWSVDALAIPLHLFGFVENVKLQTLVQFFKIGEQTHDALSDIRHSVLVYHRLLWIAAKGWTGDIVEQATQLGVDQWES